ncbi:MAG: hypothetical protein ABIQ81_02195 [Novosphingobium sp.]
MRIKSATLGLVLVGTLCGAIQPADEPGETAAAVSPEAPVEPAPEAAVPEAPGTPGPAAEDASALEAAFDAAVPVKSPDVPAADTPAADAPVADTSVADVPGTVPPMADIAAPPAAGTVPAKGAPPTKEYFAGVWAEQGKSCDTALDFKADGTMIGPFPRWELSDQGELTMVGNRQKVFLTVTDQNTMLSRRAPNDPPRTLKRCVPPVKDGA